MKSEADFLAPYLVYFDFKKPNYQESEQIYHNCLDNMKREFTETLNELQRCYDDVISILYFF